MSPLLALSGQSSCTRVCPLLDQSGQRWILACGGLSANDPKRTLGMSFQYPYLNRYDAPTKSGGEYEAARVHYALKRCGGRMAVSGARAAAGESADHRVPWPEHAFG